MDREEKIEAAYAECEKKINSAYTEFEEKRAAAWKKRQSQLYEIYSEEQ